MSAHRWVTGDHFGLAIPADPAALRSGGAAFLTEAFRISGALGADNAVKRISRFDEVPGGSTGRKLLLSVEYDVPDTHTDLFVKFSRDFDDPIRDRGKTQMESEVRFATLSREPGFPITVPATQFADYHRDTGSGLLISERIHLGANGIERHYHKCLDYEMPEPLDHYRALVTALARLVGGHRSGRVPADQFPVEMQAAQVGERTSISLDKLNRRLDQLADFARPTPGCCPPTSAHRSSFRACATTHPDSWSTNPRCGAIWPIIRTTSRCATGTPTSTTPGSGATATMCCTVACWTGAAPAR